MKALLFVLASVCAAPAAAQIDTFRLTDLDLRDPHVWISLAGCRDLTDVEAFGFSFNKQIQTSIETDGDGDGYLDASYLLQFMPLDQSLGSNFLVGGQASCTAPAASTACGSINAPWLADDVALSASDTCLGPLPGTVRGYFPAVTPTNGPCFVSPPTTFTLTAGGIPITLRDAQVATTFAGNPAQNLTDGLLRGFLTEADADATVIPASYPYVGGQSLSSLLPGGTFNCATLSFSDKDTNGGVSGWWVYLNFPAARATFVVDLFRDDFEEPAP